MTQKKRLCMVGAGRVGRLHTRNLKEHVADRAEIAVIVDPNTDLSGELAGEYDVAQVSDSLARAIDTFELDAVVITTPTFTHRDLAVEALDAGLSVHLEKPMAMNVAECRDIAAASARAGQGVQLGFMRRFDQDFIDAAALLRSGEIGEPMVIKSLTHGPGLPPPWANDIRTSNGLIAEVTSHDLDTISWFADSEPLDIGVRVSNFKGAGRGIDTEHFYDTMVATVTFASGALATVVGVCPADYGYDARVEVTCTAGMAEVGDVGPHGFSFIAAGGGDQRRAVYRSWRDRFASAYVREMVEFMDVIDGRTPRVGMADGERAVALAIAGTMSMLERRTVELASLDPAAIPSWQTSGGKTI